MLDFPIQLLGFLFFLTMAVTIVGSFYQLFLKFWDEQRISRIRAKRRVQAPISTSSPIDSPLEQARDRAVESVEKRFSIIRRLAVVSIILVLSVAIAVPFLGEVPAAAISLLVAATSIVLGIAAKPFLENFIGGIVLTFARPFRTGDTVLVDDCYGTIEDLSMTYTIIKTWDWQRYVIPNSVMMNKNFVNYTLRDSYLWAYVEFWVAPDANLEKVKEVSIEAAARSEAFSDYEPPDFWLMEMGEKGLRCWVAAWADSPADAWQLKSDIRTELVKELNILELPPHRFSLDVQHRSKMSKSKMEPSEIDNTRIKQVMNT